MAAGPAAGAFWPPRSPAHPGPKSLAPRLAVSPLQAIISNLRSQPVITDWIGVRLTKGGGRGEILTLADIMAQTGFVRGSAPDPRQPSQLQQVLQEDLLPYGVQLANEQMKLRRQERVQGIELRQDMRDSHALA